MADSNLSYHQIASVIGPEKALELSMKAGGTDVYLPVSSRITGKSRIVQLVGADAAMALGAEFGPTHTAIPLGPGRRARIWAMRAAGWTVGAIAMETGCTSRTVWNILAGQKPELLPDVPPPFASEYQRHQAVSPRDYGGKNNPQSADERQPGGGEAVPEPAVSPPSPHMPLDLPLTGV